MLLSFCIMYKYGPLVIPCDRASSHSLYSLWAKQWCAEFFCPFSKYFFILLIECTFIRKKFGFNSLDKMPSFVAFDKVPNLWSCANETEKEGLPLLSAYLSISTQALCQSIFHTPHGVVYAYPLSQFAFVKIFGPSFWEFWTNEY